MSDGDNYYIVRGAKMRCNKGSHARKINLPVSHGSYVKGKPMMNQGDNVVDKNISYFGICSECQEGDDIYLIAEDGSTINGKKCLVEIFGEWSDVKEDTLVEGKGALTTDSWLVCSKYQGKIKFETNGQEEE
ncbi:DUF4280 domain-containing protein [Clostridium saccharobutylicum]|uniref:DUF4280 domain-containing protein n=1 Tax=Clostridium saccharobutylicum TaxID=169679 RepID=A0A1S8MT74_CLOSA|nr:DUF4280 domain-containing protein [Clostridium saccharobutylicum]OOM07382.1 hypothetical protein CLOSAC_39110 [Clostridium saccharobutylicum]